MAWGTPEKDLVYCCIPDHGNDIYLYRRNEKSWEMERFIAENTEPLLQLQLSYEEEHIIGTSMLGFLVSIRLKLYFNALHFCRP